MSTRKKYTDRDREEVLAMAANGLTNSQISEIKQMPKQTVSKWIIDAEKDGSDLGRFREMQRKRMCEQAYSVFRASLGFVEGKVNGAVRSQDDVQRVIESILLSGVDDATAKEMTRIVREHCTLTAKDAVSIMNSVFDKGCALEGGQTGDQQIMIEFGGGEGYAV